MGSWSEVTRPGPEQLGAIEGLGALDWSGTTYRHTSPGRDPLSGRGAYLFGGRWNPKELVPTIYLATSTEVCIAEFIRMADRQAKGTQSFLPRDLHIIEVKNLQLLDLRSASALAAVGLTGADLTDETWSACQAVGAATHLVGRHGLLVPSAAGVGDNLVVFEGSANDHLEHRETVQLNDYL